MIDKTYIGEGHYEGENGKEYMSIWTFKRNNNIGTNNRDQNYEDAIALSDTDKFKGPFNKSEEFKQGWMYEVNALKSFYNS